jgi:hypothetical protein
VRRSALALWHGASVTLHVADTVLPHCTAGSGVRCFHARRAAANWTGCAACAHTLHALYTLTTLCCSPCTTTAELLTAAAAPALGSWPRRCTTRGASQRRPSCRTGWAGRWSLLAGAHHSQHAALRRQLTRTLTAQCRFQWPRRAFCTCNPFRTGVRGCIPRGSCNTLPRTPGGQDVRDPRNTHAVVGASVSAGCTPTRGGQQW